MNISTFTASRALLISATALLPFYATLAQGSGFDLTGDVPPAPKARSLGTMELKVNSGGGEPASWSARMVSGSGPNRDAAASTDTLSEVIGGLDIAFVSGSDELIGTTRYLYSTYKVRNAQFCGTPGSCPAYPSASHNLTFVAVATPNTVDGTAVHNFYTASGSAANPALALQLLPTNPVDAALTVIPGLASLQLLKETEVASSAVAWDSGITGMFPYGFVVNNVNSTTTRSLPASPAINQFDGQVTFAFKIPKQAVAANDPTYITVYYEVVDDPNTRVSQSPEQQNYASDLIAAATAKSLRSSDIAIPGGHAEQLNSSSYDPICSVRTAGSAASPTAYLVNDTTADFAATPYNLPLPGLPTGVVVNTWGCAPLTAFDASSFVISGSQSGLRTASMGTWAGSGSNFGTFTPTKARRFFPGETISYTKTAGTGGTPFVGSFSVLNNSGNAGPLIPSSGILVTPTRFLANIRSSAIALGDFNGDGQLDEAIVSNTNGSFVSILLLSTQGTTVSTSTLTLAATGGNGTVAVGTGDFNGDGKLDLVTVNSSSRNVSVLINSGDAALFAPGVTYAVGASPSAVAVADFNGDGKLDLIVTNAQGGTASVLLGTGDGTFDPAVSYPVGNSPRGVAVGDFNKDGKPDIAVTNSATGLISVLFGNGDGSFGTAKTYSLGGGSPTVIRVADLDGDGYPDLVVTESAGHSIDILYGSASGTFGSLSKTLIGSRFIASPNDVTVADFNADGKLDLAVSVSGGTTIYEFAGNGLRGFSTLADVQVPIRTIGGVGYFGGITAADMNSDGKIDAVLPVSLAFSAVLVQQ